MHPRVSPIYHDQKQSYDGIYAALEALLLLQKREKKNWQENRKLNMTEFRRKRDFASFCIIIFRNIRVIIF